MAAEVIWEREVDFEAIARRTQKFITTFGVGSAVILLAGLVFAGWQNTIGIAILLGIAALMAGAWVRFSSLSDQANPTLSVIDRKIVMGPKEIRIADVESFTTFATSVQTSVFGDRSRIWIGKALFKTKDEVIELGWPKMQTEGIEGVKQALEGPLAGRWVAPEDMIELDSTPPRRAARRHL